MKHETISEGMELFCGDSREIIPTLHGVDVVVTDPPYGIEGGSGKRSIERGKANYDTVLFEDNAEYIKKVCAPIIQQCADRFGRVVLTPGSRNQWDYPRPYETGSFYYPAGAGLCRWGFNCYQPILFYGKDPYGGKLGQHNSRLSTEPSDAKIDHPCPKPIKDWTWLVRRSSKDGETVLDPFMGSGTTGVACVMLGRKFIGIELEPKYFDVACKRIAGALKQGDMFVEKPKPAKQESMFSRNA